MLPRRSHGIAFRPLLILLIAVVVGMVGCDRDENGSAAHGPAVAPAPPPAAAPASNPTSRESRLPRVVFLGDSLTAGLGVDASEAFPALVGETLKDQGRPVEVVNAGVSGDTTAGGLRRLDWLLKQKPDVVVVGLGGNDGLRGLDVKASEENLRQIIRRSQEAGARVVLLGMLIPPNYGPEYDQSYGAIYPRLAKQTGVELVPFLLEGVGGEARLNQPDGIHPTAEGHRVVAQTVLPHLRKVLPQE
jgi:acyl-CoA thioesterase-1